MWVVGATPEVNELSRWREITGICLTFTVLMSAVVTLRFWIRRKTLHAEDWVILVTALASVFFNAATISQTRYGLGLPLHLRVWSEFHKFMLANYFAWPLYVVGVAGFKIALCLSYLRMTSRTMEKRYRMLIICVATLTAMGMTAFVFVALFQCSPLSKMFSPFLPGHCLPWGPIIWINSGLTIFGDVLIFLLPLPLVYQLQLETSVKVGLTFVFSLGLFTCLCSVLRATQIYETVYGSGDSSRLTEYSALEINVGIITASLPVLRPVLRPLHAKFLTWLRESSARTPAEDSLPMTSSQKSKPSPSSRTRQIFSSTGIERLTSTLSSKHRSADRTYGSETGGHERFSSVDSGKGAFSVRRTVDIDVQSVHLPAAELGEGRGGLSRRRVRYGLRSD